jgi:hypothetical protein
MYICNFGQFPSFMIRIRIHIPNTYPDPGESKNTADPDPKNTQYTSVADLNPDPVPFFYPGSGGSGINIPDPHRCSLLLQRISEHADHIFKRLKNNFLV